MSIETIMQIPKIEDVKVDFVNEEGKSQNRLSSFSLIKNNSKMPISMNDEIVETDLSIKSEKKNIGFDGAVILK
jgi:hypothetical protein